MPASSAYTLNLTFVQLTWCPIRLKVTKWTSHISRFRQRGYTFASGGQVSRFKWVSLFYGWRHWTLRLYDSERLLSFVPSQPAELLLCPELHITLSEGCFSLSSSASAFLFFTGLEPWKDFLVERSCSSQKTMLDESLKKKNQTWSQTLQHQVCSRVIIIIYHHHWTQTAQTKECVCVCVCSYYWCCGDIHLFCICNAHRWIWVWRLAVTFALDHIT